MALAVLLMLTGGRVLANDSSYADYAGQIHFIKNDDIALEKETLYFISEGMNTRIRVSYQMKNESAEDRPLSVAFPLPDIDRISSCRDGFTSVPNCETPEMKLKVNGRSAAGVWESYFTYQGKRLFPFTTHDAIAGFDDADRCASPEKRSNNVYRSECTQAQLELCAKLQQATGKATCGEAQDDIRISRAFLWKYTFPARKVSTIEHEYLVSRGLNQGYRGWPFQEDQATFIVQNDKQDFACVKELSPTTQKLASTHMFSHTLYVLKTGANWKGPIRHFELVVRKEESEIVSTCLPGLKKTGPREFRAVMKNFEPKADIALGYIELKRKL